MTDQPTRPAGRDIPAAPAHGDSSHMQTLPIDPTKKIGELPAIRGVMTEWMFAEGGVDPGRTVDPAGVELGYGSLLPLREEDVALAAEIGVNTVRLAVEHAGLERRDAPGAYREAGFRRVEELLGWCGNHGLDVILDLHNALGRERGGDPRLWQQPEFRDRFCDVWREIVRRFRAHPHVIAYEPLNEPEPRYTDDWAERYRVWNELAPRVTDAIRALDAEKPIIIDSIEYAHPSAFQGLQPTGDANTIYSFHWYSPGPFHCQKRPWIEDQSTYHYPGEFKDGWWNRARIREAWRPASDFAARHGAGLFCGEFGCVSDCPEMEDLIWLLDVVSLLDELGIGWTYYHFLFRTVEPYWRDHFDCSLFIRDAATGALRRLDRKVALLSDLLRLRGSVLAVDPPADEMVAVYAVAEPDGAVRVYAANKSPDEPKALKLTFPRAAAAAVARARRMARGTGGFTDAPDVPIADGRAELRLEPLSLLRLQL